MGNINRYEVNIGDNADKLRSPCPKHCVNLETQSGYLDPIRKTNRVY